MTDFNVTNPISQARQQARSIFVEGTKKYKSLG